MYESWYTRKPDARRIALDEGPFFLLAGPTRDWVRDEVDHGAPVRGVCQHAWRGSGRQLPLRRGQGSQPHRVLQKPGRRHLQVSPGGQSEKAWEKWYYRRWFNPMTLIEYPANGYAMDWKWSPYTQHFMLPAINNKLIKTVNIHFFYSIGIKPMKMRNEGFHSFTIFEIRLTPQFCQI